MKRGPASGDGVVRAATVSSELLLETLRACRSWGELFEVSLVIFVVVAAVVVVVVVVMHFVISGCFCGLTVVC